MRVAFNVPMFGSSYAFVLYVFNFSRVSYKKNKYKLLTFGVKRKKCQEWLVYKINLEN